MINATVLELCDRQSSIQIGTGWDGRQGTWTARAGSVAVGYDCRMNDVVIQHPRSIRDAALAGSRECNERPGG